MIYKYKELKKKYKSDYQIKKAISDKKIYKLDDGIYSDKKNNHYLEVFTVKYPGAVLSGDTAYYYHNLTDVIPFKICFTTKRNCNRCDKKKYSQSFREDKYYELGKTTMNYEGLKVNIYDKEKMLVELVKNKKDTPYDYYKEIINSYRKIKSELNINKICKYTKVYPNGEKLLEMIQDEVF